MKANVRRGRGFRGLLRYALDRGDQCAIVGGNMSGLTPNRLAAEFGISRRVRPDVERPVWHCTLSLPPGERLRPDEWDVIAHRMMERMGMPPDRHQFVAVLHTDTPCEHIHIMGSRIGLDGTLWYGVNDAFSAQAATQALEVEFGLTLTKGPDVERENPGAGVRAGLKLSQAERELWAQRDAVPPKAVIARLVEKAIRRGDGTPENLQAALAKAGVDARISVGRGRVTGISYSMEAAWEGGSETVAYKGTQVGGRCDARSIEARLAERRAEVAKTVGILKRADDIRFEAGLRASAARLDEVAANIRRRRDAEQSAPAGAGTARDSRADRPGDGTGGSQPGESPGPAGLRQGQVDNSAAGSSPADVQSETSSASEPDRAGDGDRGDGGGRRRPASADRGAGGGEQNRHDPRVAGGGGEPPISDRAANGEDRGHPERDPPRTAEDHPEADPHPDDVVWFGVEVEIEATIVADPRAARPRSRQDWHRLAMLYREAFTSRVAPYVHQVRADPEAGHVQVTMRDGSRITDNGRRINLSWNGAVPPAAVAAMVEMAKARGLRSVRMIGDDAEFRRAAWLACQRAGIEVREYRPPADLVAAWKAEQAQALWQEQRAAAAEPVETPDLFEDIWGDVEAADDTQDAWYRWAAVAKIYRQRLDARAAAHVRYVRSNRPGGPVVVGLNNAAQVHDAGRTISTTWRADAGVSAEAVNVMAAMAKAKGWKALRMRRGDDAFQAQAWLACQRAGVEVVDFTPSAELAAAWEAERTGASSHGQNGGTDQGRRAPGPGDGQPRRDEPAPRATGPDSSGDGGGRGSPGPDRGEPVRPAPEDRGWGGGEGGPAAPDDRASRPGRSRRRERVVYNDFLPGGAPTGREPGRVQGNAGTAAGSGADRRDRDDDRPVSADDGLGRTDASTARRRGNAPGASSGPGENWDSRFKRASAKRDRDEQAARHGVADDAGRVRGARGQAEPGQHGSSRTDRGSPTAPVAPDPNPGEVRRPGLPYQTKEGRQAARRWLIETHKIPPAVVARAEQAKFIHACGPEVAFLGWDHARRWAVSAWMHPLPQGRSRAAAHSDPSTPPVLIGGSDTVFLCTDGLTALNALAEAERAGRKPPTVIALYGPRPDIQITNVSDEARQAILSARSVLPYGTIGTPELLRAIEALRGEARDDVMPPRGPRDWRPD